MNLPDVASAINRASIDLANIAAKVSEHHTTHGIVVLRCEWQHAILWFANLSPVPGECPARIAGEDDAHSIYCRRPLARTASGVVVPDGR